MLPSFLSLLCATHTNFSSHLDTHKSGYQAVFQNPQNTPLCYSFTVILSTHLDPRAFVLFRCSLISIRMLRKWNQTVCNVLRLVSFSIIPLRFIQVFICINLFFEFMSSILLHGVPLFKILF